MKSVKSEMKQFVTLLIEGVPDVRQFMVTDTFISPECVDIIYRWELRPDLGKETWPVMIQVSGPRRLPTGELDRSRELSRTAYTSDDEWPEWLAELVENNRPWPAS